MPTAAHVPPFRPNATRAGAGVAGPDPARGPGPSVRTRQHSRSAAPSPLDRARRGCGGPVLVHRPQTLRDYSPRANSPGATMSQGVLFAHRIHSKFNVPIAVLLEDYIWFDSQRRHTRRHRSCCVHLCTCNILDTTKGPSFSALPPLPPTLRAPPPHSPQLRFFDCVTYERCVGGGNSPASPSARLRP
jgi:hypothetical protein